MPKKDEDDAATPKGVDPVTAATGKTNTAFLATELLKANQAGDVRADAANQRAMDHLAQQAKLWQRTTMALILVLLVLVAGVVGVGVSGKLPGIGDITISDKDAEPVPEPESKP